MIYPIVIYGSSGLRSETQEVGRDFPDLKKLIEDMFETMYSADGVGLAAPQIGKNIRIFVADATPGAESDSSLEGFKKAFVNPEIYYRGEDEVLMNEGCLSVPGIHEDVYRPERIKIRYMDEDLEPHDEEYEGYAARIIQHEYDHLDGMLFTDLLSPLRKTLLRGKLSGMSKGKFKASYKTKQTK